jgi:DNA-binding NtrC family response regulator
MPDLPEELPTHLPEAPLYIGRTAAMRRAAQHILALAATEATSGLILGESGTGKELVAGAIHRHSRRATRPFIPINCGAIPAKLAEAELFGAEPGAFTGARLRHGFVEQAHTGTLFLDEIGELPLALQPTLLRFLQTRRFRRLGSERDLGADVRILAATLRDLTGAMQVGAFREDLFFRLNVITITLPPLRDRREDLPHLVAALLRERAASLGVAAVPACDPATLALFAAYRWPGNLRELRNVLEHALLFSQGAPITPDHLPDALRTPSPAPAPELMPSLAAQIAALALPTEGVALLDLVHLLEDRLIAHALARTDGNQSHAARLLGLTRDQLRQRLKRG